MVKVFGQLITLMVECEDGLKKGQHLERKGRRIKKRGGGEQEKVAESQEEKVYQNESPD